MSARNWKYLARRRLGTAIAPLLVAWLTTSCGGGGSSDTPVGSIAAAEPNEAATQVAAAGGDAALAVEAVRAQSLHADPNRIRQVIVFGDSLSDVGTYKVGDIAAVGGGKFTTNPGPVWAETIGLLLGTRVTPFRQGYAGTSQVLGGTGFAMGGARVSQQPGIRCNPDPTTGACTAALTIPVTDQITDYLTANGDRFSRSQIVFVLAGANDIFYQLYAFVAKLQSGVTPGQATSEALEAIQQAAGELAVQVQQRILAKGAKRVVVLNVPEITDSPFGNAPSTAPLRPLIAGMVQAFNGTLAAALSGSGAQLLDLRAEFQRVAANPGAYHVHEMNVPACDAAKIAAITHGLVTDGTSLYCSRDTLVQNGAAISYLYADDVHPTTLGHLIMARFVLIEVWKRGLL